MSTKEEFAAGRKLYYATFSKFFVFSEDEKRFDGLSKMLDLIKEYSLNDEVSQAVAKIKSKFNEKNPHIISKNKYFLNNKIVILNDVDIQQISKWEKIFKNFTW